MTALRFERSDVIFVAHWNKENDLSVFLGAAGQQETRVIGRDTANKWLQSQPGVPLIGLRDLLQADQVISQWRTAAGGRVTSIGSESVARVCIDINDLDLAGLPWEQSLRTEYPRWLSNIPIVRISHVPPRGAQIPLTLPLRFVQVGPVTDFRVVTAVPTIFGGRTAEEISPAVEFAECDLDELSQRRVELQWPTAEILHFDSFPTLRLPEVVRSTATPEQIGNLGWLTRLTDTWQTRLVILRTQGAQEMQSARQLLTALAARGGPAGLAVSDDDALEFFPEFYNQLIHDFPLDVAVRDSRFFNRAAPQDSSTLVIGGGRAEAVRGSSIGEQLLEVNDAYTLGTAKGQTGLSEITDYIRRSVEAPERVQTDLFDGIGNMSSRWKGYQFEFRESDGLLPLAREIKGFRDAIRVPGPKPHPRRTRRLESPQLPRYVNPSLWEDQPEGLNRLTPEAARLNPGRIYYLGVQVAPKDTDEVIIGAEALIEEHFKWTPEMKGVWLEIGVTGLDFEVLGDPVQELWLPREASSERITFSIVPRTTGAARLRFCVYHKRNLVQSFRLAAWISDSNPDNVSDEERRRFLAAALDVPLEVVPPSAWYQPRCEYSTTTRVEDIAGRPERTLSIVANDLDGDAVITVNGPDAFGVEVNSDLPMWVQLTRDTLQTASYQEQHLPDHKFYAFGRPNQANATTEAIFKPRLMKLAEAGWNLYDQVIPNKVRKNLTAALDGKVRDGKQAIIHVAHVLAESVIPWALIYDRPYRAGKKKDKNKQPVEHDVCLAAVPNENGKLPVNRCGEHPQCLLHRDQIQQRAAAGQPALLEETVACPLHFWGFTHVIESPAQQTDATESVPSHVLRDKVTSDGSVHVKAGFNTSLTSYKTHRAALMRLLDDADSQRFWEEALDHDDVVNLLTDADVQIIYLFCHARGGKVVIPPTPPRLEFANEGYLAAGDLHHDDPWQTNPLVFLNGCETAAFSPDALSPFVRKFVRDREAAGVVGTETPVWEQLAAEFAEHFFAAFINRMRAGEAVLKARRVLLSQLNPLALSYTLYASADVHLAE